MHIQRPPTASKQIDPRRNLGLRVKELRAEHGLTQEELADRCGLFRTYLSRIESGQANPTLTVIYEVAAAFPIDVRDLLTSATNSDQPKVRSPTPLSRGRVQR